MTGVVRAARDLKRGDMIKVGQEDVTIHTITHSKDRVQLIWGWERSARPEDAGSWSGPALFEHVVVGSSDLVMPVLGGAA